MKSDGHHKQSSHLALLAEKIFIKGLGRSIEQKMRRWRKRLLGQAFKYTALSHSEADSLHSKFRARPKVSIIVPVFKVRPHWLDVCIKSVSKQYYSNWELILVDDHSDSAQIAKTLHDWKKQDKRIKVISLDANKGISYATNVGIAAASGSFIGFLDHDDELTPDALTWTVWAHNRFPNATWFYSDEVKIAEDGFLHSPVFKPNFSFEHLLSAMFTCHFSVYSAEQIRKVAGLRMGFEGAQDHDLALRLAEVIPQQNVIHIPRILYHWRQVKGSTALSTNAKPYAPEAGIHAVSDALKRRRIKGKVYSSQYCPTLYRVILEPQRFPSVTIIVATRNKFNILKNCLESIRRCTNYPNFKILVIDNQSDEPKLLDYIESERSRGHLDVMQYPHAFNHSEMHNLAVNSLSSEFVLFLNNDTEIKTEGWLGQLVATAQLNEKTAGVGGMLYGADEKVQHAGIILGLNGVVGIAHRAVPVKSSGYCHRLKSFQELSGYSAAMLLVRRMPFLEVGGFDAQRYPTSFNDADLWMRLRQAGYRCIYNPYVEAVHLESVSRGKDSKEREYIDRFRRDWGHMLVPDPFYSPNLSTDNEQFRGVNYASRFEVENAFLVWDYWAPSALRKAAS